MKLRSKKTTLLASLSAMTLSVVVIVGIANLVDNTDSKVKNASYEVDITDFALEDRKADVVPVGFEMVMATESQTEVSEDQEEAELDTELQAETETDAEEETKSAYSGKFMVNVNEYLNIRVAADENSDVVGKLYAGAGGTVLEKGDEWTKISSGSVEGYVSTQYLLFDEEAEAKANEVGVLKTTILEDSIRVRKSPSTDAGVWGLAEKDEVYNANQVVDGWAEINFEGETGYVSTDFVKVELVVATAISIEEEQEQIRLEEERKAAEEAEKIRQQEEQEAEAKRVAAANQFVETVQTSAYNVSEDDVYLLACLVCAEAASEPYEGKLAVANVVLNRLRSGIYGTTISDVIYAKNQFSVVNNGRLSSIISSGPDSESIKAAKEAVSGVNNVPNYSNFRSCSVANYSSYNNYSIIGNQVFFN
jgi:spore germination cell wall hydrolase CwlJ-like protein/SH3-like domain-containing protein